MLLAHDPQKSRGCICFQAQLNLETREVGSVCFCEDSFGSVPSVCQICHYAGAFHGSSSDKRVLTSPHHTDQRKREFLVAAQDENV